MVVFEVIFVVMVAFAVNFVFLVAMVKLFLKMLKSMHVVIAYFLFLFLIVILVGVGWWRFLLGHPKEGLFNSAEQKIPHTGDKGSLDQCG